MIAAIVPAAGQSRRMGQPKPLLPFGATTVIGHVVDELLRGNVDDVCVVVGHEADLVARALSQRRVRIVVNPDYRQTEMLASVRCGLRAVPPDCAAILVALGDQPAITAELVRAMIGRFAAAGAAIVVPLHDGRRGHPLLLAQRYRQEILTGYDQLGLRGLLAAHAEDVFELPVADAGVLADMDYPDDYRRELARLSRCASEIADARSPLPPGEG
ncbi:MAG: nucleotidyltransferase family protein [Thermoguttaceae bacterium]|jgi:CTP:molybdopterin cytidylyltransferase MocA